MLRSSRREVGHQRTVRRGVATALSILLGISGLALWAPTATAQDEGFLAYVNTTALNLRAAPGTKANIVGILLKYDPVTVQNAEPIKIDKRFINH